MSPLSAISFHTARVNRSISATSASAIDHPTLPAFSFISWTARAPRSGELTPGRLVSHWIASCAMDLRYFAAIGRKPSTASSARS